MNNIFRILPPEYAKGEMVIIFFGLANLVSASAGACKIILSTSSYYKYQTYMMIILIVVVIISNIILIPIMGITGAAVASLISMFIYTGLTVMALKKFFGLWPFVFKHMIALLLTAVIYLAAGLIPEMNLIVDIAIRSTVIIILFGAGVLLFNLSEDSKSILNSLRKNR